MNDMKRDGQENRLGRQIDDMKNDSKHRGCDELDDNQVNHSE